MDLNLKDVWLEMGGHSDTGDADANSGERVERGDIRWRFGDGILTLHGTILVVMIPRGKRTGGKPSSEPLGLETHPDKTSEPVHDLMEIATRLVHQRIDR